MEIDVSPATPAEKPVLANLLELYHYDFSEFDDVDVDEDGRFGYDYLDNWWADDWRYPFLLRVDGRLAGFALLARRGYLRPDPQATEVNEFFVMRRYRRRGVGERFARALFDRFPGAWEVRELERNVPAQQFWRAVIGRYTGGRFEDRGWNDDRWRGPVQFFNNAGGPAAAREA